jgi:hypothetical protein
MIEDSTARFFPRKVYDPGMALLINGQRIESGVIQNEFAGIKSHFERIGNVSCCERDEEFRGYARDNIIARVLLSQEAEKRMARPPEREVDEALSKMMAEYGGEARFYAALGASPEHLPLIRHDVEVNLQVERLIDSLGPAPSPTDVELREFHQSHQDAFMTDEQVRASHISKNPKHGEIRREVYETFRKVRQQLLQGADFDELARQHSDRGQDLIDLGLFKRGDLPEEVDFVAFSMNEGEISPVFTSSVGFHILKLTEKIPAQPKPFEEVRDDVQALLLSQIRQERTQELVKQLQSTAKIEEVEDEFAVP